MHSVGAFSEASATNFILQKRLKNTSLGPGSGSKAMNKALIHYEIHIVLAFYDTVRKKYVLLYHFLKIRFPKNF